MPRPSSPLNAKASVRSPYALDRSQQNSCVGTDAGRRSREPGQRPHMRFVFQTMMSSRIRPPSARGQPDEPFNSRCQMPPSTRPKAEAETRCFPRSRGCPLEGWWSQTGSNRRPHACKARALPTELWPLKRPAQRELSSIRRARPRVTRSVVGPGRLELPTSRLSGVCSNQLSYRPLKRSAQDASPLKAPGA